MRSPRVRLSRQCTDMAFEGIVERGSIYHHPEAWRRPIPTHLQREPRFALVQSLDIGPSKYVQWRIGARYQPESIMRLSTHPDSRSSWRSSGRPMNGWDRLLVRCELTDRIRAAFPMGPANS